MSEQYKKNKYQIKLYTREPDSKNYPDGLARSIHMAYSTDGINFTPLNHNYGIVFATAKIRENNTIEPKCVKDPWAFIREDGEYGIAAFRVNEDGSYDGESEGKLLLWTTPDFIHFTECGLVDADKLPDSKNASVIAVDASVCDAAVLAYGGMESRAVEVTKSVCVKTREELKQLEARVRYTDGSTALKQIEWDYDAINFDQPGRYHICGTIQNEKYDFPLARGYGDPVILPWEGKYYFIATNDNTGDVGLYVREADDIKGLFAEDIEQHIILDLDEKRGFVQTFWAPEFHRIGGELYILFAVSGTMWGPQCHIMKLKKGGNILSADSWEEPVRVMQKDGTYLATGGITLDMTYIRSGDTSYMVWSYREHIMSPGDTGSMLYIATVDEKEPWKLTSEPVLLSRPLYGWENVAGTINNEGPYAFVTDDTVYLTYSGGAADSYTYAIGLLTAKVGENLLDPCNWEKAGTPVLSFTSVPGVYGPGHNSFFTDARGNLMIAYHGETAIDSRLRCDGIHRIHFNVQGKPVFYLSAERDLNPALCKVEIDVIVP